MYQRPERASFISTEHSRSEKYDSGSVNALSGLLSFLPVVMLDNVIKVWCVNALSGLLSFLL